MRPEGSDGLDAQALAQLVTRDAMIGTGLALAPPLPTASR
jgi:nitrile hydratase